MESTLSDVLQRAAGIIGFLAYIPLTIGILKNTASQSFAAFLLWALLDTIAMITTIMEAGNFWLPMSNVVGASAITLLMVFKKQILWSWIETMTAILVLICLVVWYAVDEKWGIVSSSLAIVIASIPQMVETFRNPLQTPIVPYIIFLVANILSFSAGKAWTIEERFYAGCSVFLCLVIVLFAIRNFKLRVQTR